MVDTDESPWKERKRVRDVPDKLRSKGFVGSPVMGYVRSAKLGDPQLDVWEAEIRAYCAERGYNLVL
jgi:hypothetical protein